MPTVPEFRFSKSVFVQILDALKSASYRCVTFSETLKEPQSGVKTCLLRHDVDVSMQLALEMARLEHEHGIQSTYFVMLRSPMYNLMSRHDSAILVELALLGHEIGLHFDAGCRPNPGMTLEEELRFELDVLSQLSGHMVRSFSFHQPTPEIIESRLELPGVINTYHPSHLSGYKYISDSNRVWRELNPFQLIDSGLARLHMLLHPVWWMCSDADVKDCWDHAIRLNFVSMQAQLLGTERAYGEPRAMTLIRY